MSEPKKYGNAVPSGTVGDKLQELDENIKEVKVREAGLSVKSAPDPKPYTANDAVVDVLKVLDKVESISPRTDQIIQAIGKLRGAIIKLQK